jgi:hypothetical protein
MGDSARENWRRRRGRKAKGPPFVQLFHHMIDTEAWHRLSLVARAAYVELARVYDGSNNGRLGMSVRTLAARIPCNKDTASKALNELEQAGFADVMKTGVFHRKERHSTEYRLTVHGCDVTGVPASKRFDPRRRWEAVPKRRDPRSGFVGQTVRAGRTAQPGESQSVRPDGTDSGSPAQSSVRPDRTHIESNHARERATKSAVANAHGVIDLTPWPFRASLGREQQQPAPPPPSPTASTTGLDQFERVFRQAVSSGPPPSRSYVAENQRHFTEVCAFGDPGDPDTQRACRLAEELAIYLEGSR